MRALLGLFVIGIVSHAATYNVPTEGTTLLLSAAEITGSADLVKTGPGILQIPGALNFTGNIVINGGELRVQGPQAHVDAFLTADRLRGLSGTNGVLTFAYTDDTPKDRIISAGPVLPTNVRLGFDALNNPLHSYGLGGEANQLQNFAGLVIHGGQVYLQTSQDFRGNGAIATTIIMDGGEFSLYGGASPTDLSFNGSAVLSGGTLDGGGLGGAKGTLIVRGNVQIESTVTITGTPNLTMSPEAGQTSHLTGTAKDTRFYSFAVAGEGTVRLDSTIEALTYIEVRSGLLELGASDRIGNSSPLRLSGGTFSTRGSSERLGQLVLSATSDLDLGHGTEALYFANSSSVQWKEGATLRIHRWSSGRNLLSFEDEARPLSAKQLSAIVFAEVEGAPAGTTFPAEITATGEIRPRGGDRILLTPGSGSITLSWPAGYRLLSTVSLAPPLWIETSIQSPAIIPTGSGMGFYQLAKP